MAILSMPEPYKQEQCLCAELSGQRGFREA